MKINIYNLMAFVLMGSTLAQTDNASQLNAGAWGSTDEIFVPDPAVAIGQFFVGACSAAQSDMFDYIELFFNSSNLARRRPSPERTRESAINW